MQLGARVHLSFAISGNCYIQGANGITFGDGTIFAPGVKIISANHDRSNLEQWVPEEPIKIGDECWIGANAVILPGVHLGNRTVVAAGAVVTKSFPDASVVAGVPAKRIL
jgi:acetyltransferase-like isoleucine patch superfamily enzyme